MKVFSERQGPTQLHLPFLENDSTSLARSDGDFKRGANKLDANDRAFHGWYRFVLSFPPHLVRRYIEEFGLGTNHLVLDPFCGTGTTLVEGKLSGIQTIGIEANPFAQFVSTVKTSWEIDPKLFAEQSQHIADCAKKMLRKQGIEDNHPFKGMARDLPLKSLDAKEKKLLITNSISPVPLHKTLVLLDCLQKHRNEPCYAHGLLALAKALVFRISNLNFGPEVGVGKPKQDVPVVASWLAEVRNMANDLHLVANQHYPPSRVYLSDARMVSETIPMNSVDAVITSPPYPNEKDYTRTTRLESVILGFIKDRLELRQLKRNLIRSNTRGVYKGDDDWKWINECSEIQAVAELIEKRRIELGKTSGFEKLYSKVTKLYFGGMMRHLSSLRKVLRPGAKLAYVVGDQASYLRVLIRTGHLLSELANTLGYEVVRVDRFRTRFATATREQLQEEVVVLQWPG